MSFCQTDLNNPGLYNFETTFPLPVNFEATNYTDMVDWDSMPCTEPPLTRDMTDAELDEIVEKGHRFQDFPNHTQKVEAAVRVVHETATKRASHQAMTT